MNDTKELVIRMAEAEQETVAAINGIMAKHGLPGYIYEPILSKAHQKLIDLAGRELAEAIERSRVEEPK